MKAVDTHAHIFSAQGPFIDDARYRPAADATVDHYLANLDRHDIDYGVLIQPSFFGFDNSQMLAAIAEHPQRLKGIAVVPTDIDAGTLQALTNQGIVGARLNLFGKPVPDLYAAPWRTFLARLDQQGWHLELHCPPAYLCAMLPALKDHQGPVVIDHFGRVDAEKGTQDPDYRRFIDMLDPSRHWVKISGHYRLGDAEEGPRHAQKALQLLLEHGMRDRLVWASDWPHTQYGDQVNYDATVRFLSALISEESLRRQILGKNALALYGFAS